MMSDLNGELARGREAIRDMAAAADHTAVRWSVPRAPGKWSPSQIVEHVARALDESTNTIEGLPTKFPNLPTVVRPVVRSLFFNRVLKRDAFPKARTNRAMNPESGPPTIEAGRARLEGAFARFEQACRAQPGDGFIVSSIFGRVPLTSWVRFQSLHVRHHLKQMHGGAD